MNFLKIFEIIFRCALLVLIVFHTYKREHKITKSILLTKILSFLPALSDVLFQIKIDPFSCIIYYIVLLMALYLGNALSFYERYKWWDRTIHFLSGIGFVGFGIAIANLNPGIVKSGILLFSFTFSLSIHLVWEVLEYISDCVFHGNAQ